MSTPQEELLQLVLDGLSKMYFDKSSKKGVRTSHFCENVPTEKKQKATDAHLNDLGPEGLLLTCIIEGFEKFYGSDFAKKHSNLS